MQELQLNSNSNRNVVADIKHRVRPSTAASDRIKQSWCTRPCTSVALAASIFEGSLKRKPFVPAAFASSTRCTCHFAFAQLVRARVRPNVTVQPSLTLHDKSISPKRGSVEIVANQRHASNPTLSGLRRTGQPAEASIPVPSLLSLRCRWPVENSFLSRLFNHPDLIYGRLQQL